jgi:5-hydroxyisourate hydrolase
MSPITTHILDTSLGRPASGVTVELGRLQDDGEFRPLATRTTNQDGRILDLLEDAALQAGTYRLRFFTRTYFAARAQTTFYPHVDVVFEVSADEAHYHVPLLLNPFGYSTYRGS